MRTIAHIPHPHLKISIFQYNDKYIIEMEGGPYKQTYKVNAENITVDAIKALCTDDLVANTLQRFGAMHHDFAQAFKQTQQIQEEKK
ncbi:MAG: hypothetical protein ACKVOR_03360 [Flavobacteriales bacterium]